MHSGARNEVVHLERGGHQPAVFGGRRASSERGDANHAFDAVRLQRGAGRPAKVHVRGVSALGVRIRRNEPEDRVGPRERLVHDVRVSMRSLDDLDALLRLRRQPRRIAHNRPD